MKVEVREADYSGAKDRKMILEIRTRVFAGEQKVRPEEDFDGLDDEAVHVLAFADGKPAGTARMRMVAGGVAKFERMAVLQEFRGAGVGGGMLESMLAIARRMGAKEAELGAQLHAVEFYGQHGFVAEGPVFMDARIEHRRMRMRL